MKTIIKLLLTILISGSAYAQEFKGVATYKTLTKLDLKLDEENGGGIKTSSGSFKVSSEIQEQLMEQLKKGTQQTYKLSFDKQQSVYKKEEKLAAPAPNSSGISMSFSFSGAGGDLSSTAPADPRSVCLSRRADVPGGRLT